MAALSITQIGGRAYSICVKEMEFLKKKFITTKRVVTATSFLLPGMLFYFMFMLLPIVDTANISLTNWNGIKPTFKYIGFQNYQVIFEDKIFWNAVSNTVFWVVAQLVIIILPSLLLAVCITKLTHGMTFFRAGFYLPAVISFSVAAIIWAKIYDPTMGPVTGILNGMGLDMLARNWLGNPHTVLPALVLASSWVQYGMYLVLFIAGLQSIDRQLYEAAELDGANRYVRFTRITIPSLANTMNVVVSLVLINAFKGFSMVWITTQGGPMYSSDLVATYIYREAFTSYKTGVGAAGGVVLALIVLVVTVIFNTLRERSGK